MATVDYSCALVDRMNWIRLDDRLDRWSSDIIRQHPFDCMFQQRSSAASCRMHHTERNKSPHQACAHTHVCTPEAAEVP